MDGGEGRRGEGGGQREVVGGWERWAGGGVGIWGRRRTHTRTHATHPHLRHIEARHTASHMHMHTHPRS